MTPPRTNPPKKTRQLVDLVAYVGEALDWRSSKLRRVASTVGALGGWYCLMHHAGLLP